jgi:hypothetical protein
MLAMPYPPEDFIEVRFYVRRELHALLVSAAKADDRSIAAEGRQALRAWLASKTPTDSYINAPGTERRSA